MPAFFSIIIPTYNRRELLKQTVDSVLAQTFRDFEIIVVDDGSTDNTVQYFNENYKGNPLLAIESRENKERGAARNYGLGMAKGTYVLFLDSDDILFNDHLETLHAKILELNNPDFIATKYQFIRNQKINLPGICKFPEGYYDYHFFLNGNPLGCNICVRRANRDLYLFEEDRKYAIKEDWMFLLQNLRLNRFFLIDKITLQMQDHDERSMRSDNSVIIERTELAEEWILKHLDLPDSDQKVLRAHTEYFIALHSYIDGHIRKAIHHLLNAVKIAGWKKKYVLLLLKCGIGNNTIQKLKKIVR